MDTIFIQGLLVHTTIGMYDWEKQLKQPLIFDIEIETDLKRSALSDDIHDTIDYKEVADKISEIVENQSFELIEPLSEHICQEILSQYVAAHKVHLTCHKPNAVNQAQSVGLKITRGR